MVNKEQLCKKIEEMHPDMGACGIDFEVEYDNDAKAWFVDLRHGKQHLRTFIETDDADSCLEKDKCLPLSMQIGQLKSNFEKYIHEHALDTSH